MKHPLLPVLNKSTGSTTTTSSGSTTASTAGPAITFPSAPPSLPIGQTPNYSVSTSVAGATLSAKSGKRNQLTANAARVTLTGTSGSDTFVVTDPSDVVIGNGGVDTVKSSVSYALPAGIDNLALTGNANATATGNSGSNIIAGNAGTDVIAGGGGTDILIAGGGADTFVVAKQANATTWIEAFKTSGAAIDKIDLTGFGFASFAAVQAAMTQSHSNVGINLGNGQILMLQNKQVANLTAADFVGLAAASPPPPPPPPPVSVSPPPPPPPASVSPPPPPASVSPSPPPVSTPGPTYPTAPPSLPVSGTPNNWLSTYTAGATLTGDPTKNNQFTAGAGRVTLVGGPGNDTFIAYAPDTVVVPHGGVDTVETWGSGYSLPAGVDNLTLEGSSNAFAAGNSGNNIITGNAGTDTLITGGGNDILIAGTGADTFVVTPQANTTTWIEGLGIAGVNKVSLAGYGFASFAAVQAAMTQSGSNVVLNLGNGELLMLQNEQVGSLTAASFAGLPASPPPPPSVSPPPPPPPPPPSAEPGLTVTPPPAPSAAIMPPAPSAPPNLPTSGTPNNWLSTYTAGATLTGDPTKNNQLTGGASAVTLVGGPGNDTFIAYAPDTVIMPNGGTDTVETWGSGYTLPDGVANLTLEGSSNAYASGNSGNNILTGNAGTDTLITGGGNDILIAGTGADTNVITKAGNTTTWIEGFKPGTDKIDLSQFGFTSFAAAQFAMAQVGSNVEISVGEGQVVMLRNAQLSSLNAGNVETSFSPAGLHLTFDDEFNSLSLNMGTPSTAGGTWSTYFPGWNVRTLAGNNEQELYVDPSFAGTSGAPLGLNPFSDRNGTLTITAAPAPAADLPYLSGFQYTSGMISSQNSFSQTYGYFDMRAELPGAGQGMWPAFWLLKNNNTWPPEIDVLEQVSNPNSKIFSTVIDSGQPNQQGGNNVGDTSSGFHDYGVLWTPQTITFYFDGRELFSAPTPADMNSPMYMIVNLALGGSWAGSVNASTNWALANMKIDYVRAYSLTPTATSGAPTVTFSNAADPTNLASSFAVPTLSPSTSTTYTAGQLGIAGVDPAATVTTTTDANDTLTVTNNGAWGAINNVTIDSAVNAVVTVNNFVDAQVSLGNGDSDITVNNAMRGAITVGNGNDSISVVAESDNTTNNVTTITAGDGQDRISFRGAANTTASISAGNLGNTVTVDGQASATVKSGTGNDDFIDKSTGSLTMTGGGGSDVFEFLAGAHATITDFQAGQDSIILHGLTASQVSITTSQGNTFLALGSGAQVELAGVALTANQLHLSYA